MKRKITIDTETLPALKKKADKRQIELDELLQQELDAPSEKEEMFEKGIKEGIKEGKLKGEIKGEISKIKMGLKYKLPPEEIKTELHYTNDKFSTIKDYFDQHPEAIKISGNESPIGEDLGLFGDNTDLDVEL